MQSGWENGVQQSERLCLVKYVTLSFNVILFFCCGCGNDTSPNTQKAQPSPLINGLMSYASEDEVLKALGEQNCKRELLRELEPGDKRPPYTCVELSCANYSHHEKRGDLSLFFFNNRLVSARFIPSEPADYLQKLRLEDGIIVGGGHPYKLAPSTTITFGMDENGRLFVDFEDDHLVEEYDEWSRRYG